MPQTDAVQPSSSNAPDEAMSDKKVKKNKPKGTKFRQQKLPAWQPILTAGTVIPAFLIVGVIFVPIGGILIHISSTVHETVANYTSCEDPANGRCDEYLNRNPRPDVQCVCSILITIPEKYEGDVFFYYGLSNFYQNHRRYVKSRNDQQLLGDLQKVSDCEPFDKINENPIVPCGTVANSMFNDTFEILDGSNNPLPLSQDGIAWNVDKESKFKNPGGDNPWANTEKPPAWSKRIQDIPDQLQNVDFMVWMRTAALPNFRKPWRKLNRTDVLQTIYSNGLPAGNYTLKINYSYPVMSFSGEKRFIITTTSVMGSKNNFLGIAYVVVGSLCVIMAAVFGIIHLKFGKSTDPFDRTDLAADRANRPNLLRSATGTGGDPQITPATGATSVDHSSPIPDEYERIQLNDVNATQNKSLPKEEQMQTAT